MATQTYKNYHSFIYNNSYFIYDIYNYITIEVSKNFYVYFHHIAESLDLEKDVDYSTEKSIIENLIENNYFLSSCSFDKETNLFSKDVISLSFAPIYECNFKCKYCFAEKRDDYGFTKNYFSRDMVFKTLDWLTKEAFPDNKFFRIDFVSGGEPLLNFDAIKAVVDYNKELRKESEKQIFVWLCTNGSLLSQEICKYLDENNISIGISIDGDRKTNDRNRIDSKGLGTYDLVVSKIDKIMQSSNYSKKFKEIWALTVLTPFSNVINIITHHKEHNLKNAQIKFVRSDKDDLSIYKNDFLLNEYKKLSQFLLESLNDNTDYLLMILNDNDYFGKILKRILLKEAYFYRCKAGRKKFAVCPNGDIFPCDSFIGKDEFKIGNIFNTDNNLHKELFLSVNNRMQCSTCSVRYLCGGNCYYDSYIHTKNANLSDEHFCKIYKKLCEIAIWLVYKIENEYPEQYKRILHILDYKNKITKE